MKYLIIPVLVGLSSFSFFSQESGPVQVDFAELEISSQQIKTVLQIDRSRELVRRKVLQIIDRFNPDMPLGIKQELTKVIYEMSIKYPNLDVDLICATITHESGRSWDPEVVSNAGAMGLMQLMPRTGEWLAQYEDIEWIDEKEVLFNPIYNIRMGCRYLSALIETYELEGGLAAYNGGERIAREWLAHNKADGILWNETTNYIPFVLKLYDEFKRYTL